MRHFFVRVVCIEVLEACLDNDVADYRDHGSSLCNFLRRLSKKLKKLLGTLERDSQVFALLPNGNFLCVWFAQAFVSLGDVASECARTRILHSTVLASKNFSLTSICLLLLFRHPGRCCGNCVFAGSADWNQKLLHLLIKSLLLLLLDDLIDFLFRLRHIQLKFNWG